MTPQEEKLIIELHSRWGNRWSRIARRLPGRTDNEIKNYWRTHMRKKAQERQNTLVSPSSSSSSSSSSSLNSIAKPEAENKWIEQSNDGASGIVQEGEGELKGYSMDQIWNELAISEIPLLNFEGCKETFHDEEIPEMASPLWDYSELQVLKVDDEHLKLFSPTGGLTAPNCQCGTGM